MWIDDIQYLCASAPIGSPPRPLQIALVDRYYMRVLEWALETHRNFQHGAASLEIEEYSESHTPRHPNPLRKRIRGTGVR